MRFSLLFLLVVTALVAGCRKPVARPLPQRGYVWQRAWSPAVSEAIGEAAMHLQGVVLLGGELKIAEGKPALLRATIDWPAVKRAGAPIALALRVAPYAGPFVGEDAVGRAITGAAKALLADARAAGVSVQEFQLDFDCAQKKLSGYAAWVRAVRAAVKPAPLAITTLPSWLDEAAFAALLQDVDGFVLQVHSVPLGGGTKLCDPALARAWVARAARLGRPFSVALPTYRCVAGYGPDGKLLGVAMDSVQPSWPRGTRTLELGARADDLAALVHEWQTARPPMLREVLWYRVPVSTDLRNWHWPTLAAVMAGRAPVHRLEARVLGENPADLSIDNVGETDEELDCSVIVTWKGGLPSAADALAGWSLAVEEGRAVFTPAAGTRLRLSPGGKRNIGWLRYDHETAIRLNVEEHESARP